MEYLLCVGLRVKIYTVNMLNTKTQKIKDTDTDIRYSQVFLIMLLIIRKTVCVTL